MKRIFDLTFASIVLLIFSPILLIITILIRIKLGSPIIFKQQRPGMHGKPFILYKLRTMTNKKDKNGELLEDEFRLTPFGSFLRKFSLDELPQLINVLKGEISLVGPRPLLMEYLSLYSEEQAKRLLVKPGLTGWAQVNGRNSISWEEKFKLDVWYVENQSFLLDLKILYLTVMKVIKTEDIKNDKHTTMPSFEGNSVNNNKDISL
ncbi:sugar transferase [Neobacillus drentensis]|uniref:sugar transferase n=1 Tax=Neobacillus drentensis TaxID=220684 RepID=UPI0008256381|nr:sugar transferase [Neobacillus drentensis]